LKPDNCKYFLRTPLVIRYYSMCYVCDLFKILFLLLLRHTHNSYLPRLLLCLVLINLEVLGYATVMKNIKYRDVEDYFRFLLPRIQSNNNNSHHKKWAITISICVQFIVSTYCTRTLKFRRIWTSYFNTVFPLVILFIKISFVHLEHNMQFPSFNAMWYNFQKKKKK